MTATSILESTISVECLESSLDAEYLITPIVVRIFSIYKVFWYIDLDTTECIDYALESVEVYDCIFVDGLPSDLRYLLSEELDTYLV
ncbi:MAG: hypothetical protein WAW59_05720 [Patescibacteria group bacterium]